MTNEFVKERILKYQVCLDNKVLNDTNYDSLIELLEEDSQKLKEKAEQNTYTKIKLEDCISFLKNDRKNITNIQNTTLKIFFDYYIASMTEPISDEIFDLMTEFMRFFVNRSMIWSQLTVHNLRPIVLLGQRNHMDGYYLLKYQKLLSNDVIYAFSEISHDEIFRQYCNKLCYVLIQNNKFDYLINFYNKANRIIEPKELIEYFVELKNKIDDKCFNYNLCEFLSQLFEKLDFSMSEYDEIGKIDDLMDKNKATGVNIIYVFSQILGEVCEFFKEFAENKILFDGFDKYTDELYGERNSDKFPLNYLLYKCNALTHFANFLATDIEKAAISIAICKLKSINHATKICEIERGFKFSINMFDYMEEIIDYFIYLKDKKHVGGMDEKIYRSLNLYVRAKNIRNKIITLEDTDLIAFKEKVEKRLDKLQDTVFTTKKYLADNLTDADKEDLVKKFFKSAFHKYTNDKGVSIEAKLEYEITDLSKKDIDLCYEAIKNNKSLIDQIVTGEKLIEPFARAYNMNYDYASGDYTNLVVCQIKAIERYIKEVLVQHHEDKIYKTVYDKDENKKFAYYENGWKKSVAKNRIKLEGNNPTAESLNELECGYAINALLMAYKKEGILEEFKVSCKFYDKCIDEVRNGHFHIDKIETVNEALMRRSQTAFWLMHLITKLGEKGILIR